MSDRIEPSTEVRKIIVEFLNNKPMPSDIVYYYNDFIHEIDKCLYRDFRTHVGLFAFKTYEDAETCKPYVKKVIAEIHREMMRSILGGMDEFACVDNISLEKSTPFEPFDVEHMEIPTASASYEIPDLHIGRKRFNYYELDDAKKVIAYYKGLEV